MAIGSATVGIIFTNTQPTANSIKRVTTGKWEVRTVYGVDAANEWVYFSATKDSHIAENIYRVRLTGGEPERLTQADGWHTAIFNKDLTHFAEMWSDVNNPAQTRLYRADGSLVRVINENKVDVLVAIQAR